MVSQVSLTKLPKSSTIGNLHTVQLVNSTHSSLAKSIAHTCALWDVHQKKSKKQNITKNVNSLCWRIFLKLHFIKKIKLCFIHTMECEKVETITACNNMDESYIMVSKIKSPKSFNMILFSWCSKKLMQTHTNAHFLENKEMINTLKFRVIRDRGLKVQRCP